MGVSSPMTDETTLLSVDAISCVVGTSPEDYREIGREEPRGREICLDLVERQYNREILLRQATLRTTGRSTSSVGLSLESLKAVAWDPTLIQTVVLAQSYPDIEPLAAPLQQILHHAGLEPRQPLGLTHVEGNGGIEGLRLLDWLLDPEARGLLIATEALVFLHQRVRTGVPPLANGSTCLSVRRGPGPLEIGCFLSLPEQKPLEIGLAAVIERLVPVKFIVAQTALLASDSENPVCYRREHFADFDYQSSDVWLSLASLLRSGKMRPGDKAALIATDRHSQISACVAELVSAPFVSVVEA